MLKALLSLALLVRFSTFNEIKNTHLFMKSAAATQHEPVRSTTRQINDFRIGGSKTVEPYGTDFFTNTVHIYANGSLITSSEGNIEYYNISCTTSDNHFGVYYSITNCGTYLSVAWTLYVIYGTYTLETPNRTGRIYGVLEYLP